MKIWICLFALLSCPLTCLSQEVQQAIVRPDGSSAGAEELVWNKWDTENFIVLSIDKSQGLKLKNELESIRQKVLSRWGMRNFASKMKCKLVCVPNVEMMDRLFKIKNVHVEVKQDGSSAIWIYYNKISELENLILSTIVAEYSPFLQRGILQLEKTPVQIRKDLVQLENFSSTEVLSMTRENWTKLSETDKSLFDKKAGLVCLLLRKEFGIRMFSKFVNDYKGDGSIVNLYGFKDIKKFDETLHRYYGNLKKDIETEKTPDSYLLIGE